MSAKELVSDSHHSEENSIICSPSGKVIYNIKALMSQLKTRTQDGHQNDPPPTPEHWKVPMLLEENNPFQGTNMNKK